MHRPVLITAPDMLPVSLAEAKMHMRVDHNEEDALIDGLIRAATEHLDGWTGILGRCLVEQEWRQDFDNFAPCLSLPLGPVIGITSVTLAGETIDETSYEIRTDAGGRARVEFEGVTGSGAVSVVYAAGYPTSPEIPAVEPGPGDPPNPPGSSVVPAKSTVPAPIKVAILLLVSHWYHNPEAVTADSAIILPLAVEALITPFRRVGV